MKRDRHTDGNAGPLFVIARTQKVPNYRKFLQNKSNKAALADFLSKYILTHGPRVLEEDQSITLAGGFKNSESVKVVQSTGFSDCPELFSTQEEADTRMILHAVHLAKNYSRVIIRCDDTDVLILLLFYVSQGMFDNTSIFMHAGHTGKITNRQRFIPINSIAANMGERMCMCLPLLHALSGSDTTSSIFRVGKNTAFTKLQQNIDHLEELKTFGESSDTSHIVPVTTKFVLLLYDKKYKS